MACVWLYVRVYACTYICAMYIRACVIYMCVCVYERERERRLENRYLQFPHNVLDIIQSK